MNHKRGTIERFKDCIGEDAYRVFTGCKWLDDYVICGTRAHAEKIALELLSKKVMP